MPYIKQDDRNKFRAMFDRLNGIETPGELNYLVTCLIKEYLWTHGARARKQLSYQTINDIVGALEGAKAEFQRRVVAAYEDKKIEENGDAY